MKFNLMKSVYSYKEYTIRIKKHLPEKGDMEYEYEGSCWDLRIRKNHYDDVYEDWNLSSHNACAVEVMEMKDYKQARTEERYGL